MLTILRCIGLVIFGSICVSSITEKVSSHPSKLNLDGKLVNYSIPAWGPFPQKFTLSFRTCSPYYDAGNLLHMIPARNLNVTVLLRNHRTLVVVIHSDNNRLGLITMVSTTCEWHDVDLIFNDESLSVAMDGAWEQISFFPPQWKQSLDVVVGSNYMVANVLLIDGFPSSNLAHTHSESQVNSSSYHLFPYDRLNNVGSVHGSCGTDSCNNNGVCSYDVHGNRICSCLPDFTGRFCELYNVQYSCITNPCSNGGRCRPLQTENGNLTRGFECLCPRGFYGRLCEKRSLNCSNCRYPKICIDLGMDEPQCICPYGYAGDACDRVNPCKNVQCKHDGVCIPKDDCTSVCHCSSAWMGFDCSESVPNYELIDITNMTFGSNKTTGAHHPIDCRSYLCVNGGPVESNDNCECSCDHGFTGQRCEVDINECIGRPCIHGSCLNLNGSFQCDCFDGYEGSRCQHKINHCSDSETCLNGGQCLSSSTSFVCMCPESFYGTNCFDGKHSLLDTIKMALRFGNMSLQQLHNVWEPLVMPTLNTSHIYVDATNANRTAKQLSRWNTCYGAAENLYTVADPNLPVCSLRAFSDHQFCSSSTLFHTKSKFKHVAFDVVFDSIHPGTIFEFGRFIECVLHPNKTILEFRRKDRNDLVWADIKIARHPSVRIEIQLLPQPRILRMRVAGQEFRLPLHTMDTNGSLLLTAVGCMHEFLITTDDGCILNGTVLDECNAQIKCNGINKTKDLAVTPDVLKVRKTTLVVAKPATDVRIDFKQPMYVWSQRSLYQLNIDSNASSHRSLQWLLDQINASSIANTTVDTVVFGVAGDCWMIGHSQVNKCMVVVNALLGNAWRPSSLCSAISQMKFDLLNLTIVQDLLVKDACFNDPCYNNGSCVSNMNSSAGYSCKCLEQYYGDRCQFNNPCNVSDHCKNGGKCSTNTNGRVSKCLCRLGFRGTRCQLPETDVCCNDGTVIAANMTCKCKSPFSGPVCEHNMCSLLPCVNGGVCSLTTSGLYQCQCRTGYTGRHCHLKASCQNGLEFDMKNGSKTCICKPGWNGLKCSENVETDRFSSPPLAALKSDTRTTTSEFHHIPAKDEIIHETRAIHNELNASNVSSIPLALLLRRPIIIWPLAVTTGILMLTIIALVVYRLRSLDYYDDHDQGSPPVTMMGSNRILLQAGLYYPTRQDFLAIDNANTVDNHQNTVRRNECLI